MPRFNIGLSFVCAVATLCLTVPAFAAPIVPGASGTSYTFDNTNKTYFVTTNTSLNADISNTDLYVGKTSAANLTTLGGSATFTIGTGAVATRRTPIGNGLAGYGVRTFGAFNTVVTGGSIANLFGEDTSTTTISGGAVDLAVFFNTATVNLSGNYAVNNLALGTAGTTQAPKAFISGGVFTSLLLTANSTASITGGIVPTVAGSGVFLYDTGAQANLYGTGLVATYIGLADNRDTFNITGTLQDGTVYTPSAPLPISIRNETGTGNNAPRQFTLNNPAVVPEAGSLALALPGIALTGIALVRRRRAA